MLQSRPARPLGESRGLKTAAVIAVLLSFVSLVPCRVMGSPPRASSDESPDRRIQELIDKAVSARELAYKSIPRARGTGRYKRTVTQKEGAGKLSYRRNGYKERARFQMAFDHPKEFIQFRYEPGAGYDDPDCHARVVISDGERIHESLFSRKIHPHGVSGTITKVFEKGLLDPVFDSSCGYLTKAYGFVDLLRKEPQEKELSLRDQGSLRVLQGRDPKGRFAQEFWIDPARHNHVVRYRLLNYTKKAPFELRTSLDVTRQWEKAGKLWYVKRYRYRHESYKDGELYRTRETELVLDTFEPNIPIPREVFTVHALGLVDGTRIMDRRKEGKPDRHYYHPDPQFDVRKVEAVVGELPTALPPE